MTGLPDNFRYERKFVAHGFALAEVLALVRRHPCLFREVYPPRFVNNVYLDSPGRTDYHDHVSGSPNRSKTRVRWYGDAPGHISNQVLEQKLKRGQVSGKLVHPLPAFSANGKGFGRAVTDLLRAAAVPAQIRAELHRREPALFNRYRRHYFLSADGRFRLTVDSELQFGSTNGNHGMLTPGLRQPVIILELKFAAQSAQDADTVTGMLPFRMVRCSKYVLGIEHLASAGL